MPYEIGAALRQPAVPLGEPVALAGRNPNPVPGKSNRPGSCPATESASSRRLLVDEVPLRVADGTTVDHCSQRRHACGPLAVSVVSGQMAARG